MANTSDEVKSDRDIALENYRKGTQPYFEALGEFVTHYAVLEDVISIHLNIITGITSELGKSIFSGTRIKSAIDFINRILGASDKADMMSRLKPYFDHIGHLTAARDLILHYGGKFQHSTKTLLVSNARSANTSRSLKSYEITPQDLRNLFHDTQRAINGVIYEVNRDTLDPSQLETFRIETLGPWRYRPPQQAAPRQKQKKSRR